MFNGFTPETIDFLWGIRMNNNREWFAEHKQQYIETLYQPMKELGKLLFRPFCDRPGDILKVSRIYRDARLHHPDPYKESLWICIRKDSDWWAENPCLFFELTPDYASYGFSLWHPRVSAMETFRNRIAAEPRPFFELMENLQASTGMTLTAQCYKRPKEAPNPELQPYFAWKSDVDCIIREEVSEATFGPELGERVSTFLQKLIPVYDYFNQIV